MGKKQKKAAPERAMRNVGISPSVILRYFEDADRLPLDEPAKSAAETPCGLRVGRFYTLVPNFNDSQWSAHIFELLAANATHVMVRCLNPLGRIPAEPILLLRGNFEFADAADIARAAAEFGQPVMLKTPEPVAEERWSPFGGFRFR